MTKLLITGKDGVLVRPKSGAKFVQHPEDQILLPNVAETIDKYAADGWAMAIVSNQGGVEAGYKTLDDAIAEMRYCLGLLPQIPFALFCPDFEGKVCWFVTDFVSREEQDCVRFLHDKEIPLGSYRKPGPGMLIAASNYTRIRLQDCLMVGDRDEDQGAAKSAGVEFMWADEWRDGK